MNSPYLNIILQNFEEIDPQATSKISLFMEYLKRLVWLCCHFMHIKTSLLVSPHLQKDILTSPFFFLQQKPTIQINYPDLNIYQSQVSPTFPSWFLISDTTSEPNHIFRSPSGTSTRPFWKDSSSPTTHARSEYCFIIKLILFVANKVVQPIFKNFDRAQTQVGHRIWVHFLRCGAC